MDFFDYAMLGGPPTTIGIDFNGGEAIALLLLLLLVASFLGVVLGRNVRLPRRGVWRWLSRTTEASAGRRWTGAAEHPSAHRPLTLGRALRLIGAGSRK